MSQTRIVSVPTVGEIARRLDVSHHRVEYLIRSRRYQPVGWAGNARVYGEEVVEQIASEIRRIDEIKEARHA